MLPSKDADESTRNVRLLTGLRSEQSRIMTIDVQHLVPCRGSRAQADDGVTPCLRWQVLRL